MPNPQSSTVFGPVSFWRLMFPRFPDEILVFKRRRPSLFSSSSSLLSKLSKPWFKEHQIYTMSAVAPAYQPPLTSTKDSIQTSTSDAHSNGNAVGNHSLQLHHDASDFLAKVQSGFNDKNSKAIASLFAKDVSKRRAIGEWVGKIKSWSVRTKLTQFSLSFSFLHYFSLKTLFPSGIHERRTSSSLGFRNSSSSREYPEMVI